MREMSFVEAKAHLSELVDMAQHKNERIIILRHGKPAAAIVPVDVATPRQPEVQARGMTDEEIQRGIDLLSGFEPEVSAVEDLLAGRR